MSTARQDVDWPALAAACDNINEDRLWSMHCDMARIGAIPGRGVNRQAFSQEDIEARHLLLRWLEPHGFKVEVDDIANMFIRREGEDPTLSPIATGSHMDSQPRGGRFDGIYGVLAGVEMLLAMEDAGLKTRHPVEVVAWSNEEGGRFAPGAMGSMVYSGFRQLERFLNNTDGDGVMLRDALAATIAGTPQAGKREFGAPMAAYIEAHIEQGPLLERENTTIGVVTGIQGTLWFNVIVTGESAHAGTTPLSIRRDAFQAAVDLVQDLNRLVAQQPDNLRFTIGRFDVVPNTPNSVAGEVSFSIDIRHPDQAVLDQMGEAVRALCAETRNGCDIAINTTFSRSPCTFDRAIVDAVEGAAQRLDLSHMRLSSGAFHDALFMSDICPTGMIFVPCERGISHNPAENAKPSDLAAGAKVLLAAVAGLSGAR